MTTSLTVAQDGSHDLFAQLGEFRTTAFDLNPGLVKTAAGFYGIGLLRFAPNVPNTTYWVGNSVLRTELALNLTFGGATAYPFTINVAAHMDGTKTGFPVNGENPLAPQWWVDLVPSAPSTAPRGILVGQKRILSDPGSALSIPIDMAGIIPAITDQAWSGNIYFVLWLSNVTTSIAFYDDTTTGTAPVLLLPETTLSVANRDTGRRGPPDATGPFRRCPKTGLSFLAERMVPDGWLEGTLVHPSAWDEKDWEPRPDFPDFPSRGEEAP